MTPETQLLLEAARRAAGFAPRFDARELCDRADWPRLIQLARRHALVGILDRTFGEIAPDHVRTELERMRYARIAVAAIHEQTTLDLLRDFQRASIDALAYKGQVLSRQAYGELGMREPGDIDILVRPGDASRAVERMRASGWTFLMGLDDREWPHVLRHVNAWALEKDGVLVDLHWQLATPEAAFRLSAEDAFASAVTVEAGDAQVATLATDHLLVLLAAHGAGHFWERLEWLVSFAAVAYRLEIDPESLEPLARELGALERLRDAIRRLGLLDSGDESLLENASPASPYERIATSARLFDRRRDVLRAWTTALFSPRLPDLRWVKLPRALAFLYPVVRVVRLLVRRG